MRIPGSTFGPNPGLDIWVRPTWSPPAVLKGSPEVSARALSFSQTCTNSSPRMDTSTPSGPTSQWCEREIFCTVQHIDSMGFGPVKASMLTRFPDFKSHTFVHLCSPQGYVKRASPILYTSLNGAKLGPCDGARNYGYSEGNTCFEPPDAVKGEPASD